MVLPQLPSTVLLTQHVTIAAHQLHCLVPKISLLSFPALPLFKKTLVTIVVIEPSQQLAVTLLLCSAMAKEHCSHISFPQGNSECMSLF